MQNWCNKNEGWKPLIDALQCPAKLTLTASFQQRKGATLARFRAPIGACALCEHVSDCARKATPSPRYSKEVSISLNGTPPIRDTESTKRKDTSPEYDNVQVQPRLPVLTPIAPIIITSKVRKYATEMFKACRVDVKAWPLPEPEPDEQEHFAADPLARQRRRLTIAQRIALNERPDVHEASVSMRVSSTYIEQYKRHKSASRSG